MVQTMSALILVLLLIVGCLGWNAAVASDADHPNEETRRVSIRERQFTPERTIVHHGRPTRLIIVNQDSELHTFAPRGWLVRDSVQVGGNGAPEFGPEGLKRVIIPADGSAEIRFTPREPGEYRYVCDMPGHQMNAFIVVE
jgi:plastocyanin